LKGVIWQFSWKGRERKKEEGGVYRIRKLCHTGDKVKIFSSKGKKGRNYWG